MDYGHTNDKKKIDQLFGQAITEGEGVTPENSNPDAAESLHSTDDSISWENQPGTPDVSGLGKTSLGAISAAERRGLNPASSNSKENTPAERTSSPEDPIIKDIPNREAIPSADIPSGPDSAGTPLDIPMSMPPGSSTPDQDIPNLTSDKSTSAGILSHLHLGSHHKFTEADAKLVDEAINASGDDISDLYDEVRNLVPITGQALQESGQNGK